MQPVSVTVSTSGASSNWIPLDTYNTPVNIGLYVTVTGTARYTVQHTPVNVGLLGTAAVTAGAIFNHETLVSATASDDSNYAFPIAAVRLTLVSADTNGSATLYIIQGGPAAS